jgi:hypothetical protein
METKPENPSAFPENRWQRVGEIEEGTSNPGMTLRDYFAAKALGGMFASHAIFIKIGEPEGMKPAAMRKMTNNEIAEAAYQYADDMLKARAAQ